MSINVPDIDYYQIDNNFKILLVVVAPVAASPQLSDLLRDLPSAATDRPTDDRPTDAPRDYSYYSGFCDPGFCVPDAFLRFRTMVRAFVPLSSRLQRPYSRALPSPLPHHQTRRVKRNTFRFRAASGWATRSHALKEIDRRGRR